MRTAIVLIAVLALTAAAQRVQAATCCVDGACVYLANLSTGTTPLNSLCGHNISGTGGNCNVTMAQDESIASGSCVTLTDSVKLLMNGHTITCTGSSCNTAIINADTSSLGNPVVITGQGYIRGCFTSAVTSSNISYLFGGTITDLDIDLGNASLGCQGVNGTGIATTVTRIAAGNMSGTCINMSAPTSTDIVDSLVHDCGIGMLLGRGAGSTGTQVSGSLATDNGVNMKIMFTGGSQPRLTDSAVREASVCNFQDLNGNCVATGSAAAPSLNGVNFIDNTIYH